MVEYVNSHVKAIGIIVFKKAKEDLLFNQVTYADTDGNFGIADITDMLNIKRPGVALALDALNAGERGAFLISGVVFDESFNYVPGKTLYIGTTPGEVVDIDSQPSGSGEMVVNIGYVIDPTIYRFDPNLVSIVIK